MAYGVRDVEIDYEACMEMGRDWSSPVADVINAATEHVAEAQFLTSPVSPKGSKYSPPGHLRATIHAAMPGHHDSEGRIMGLAGTKVTRSGGGWPYPARFINMTVKATVISNPYINRRTGKPIKGRKKTFRSAHNTFILDALESLRGWVYRTDR